jgi:hypothetical protein
MKKLFHILGAFFLIASSASTQTLVTDFPTVNGVVYTITESNDVLYIGGLFTSVGGLPRQNLAAISWSTYEVLPWSPGCDSTVRDIEVINGTLFICGLFQHVNGTPRNTLAALDLQTGVLSDWNPLITFPGIPGQQFGFINSVDGNDSTLFIGGYFLSVNGTPRMNLAALDLDGNIPPWWIYAHNNFPVNHVTVYGDILYVDYVYGFYGLDMMSQQHSGWNPNPTINVGGFTSLFRDTDKIYIAGPFEFVGGANRPYIAQTNATTGLPSNWNAGFTFLGTPSSDHISSINRLNDKLIVTGAFQQNTSQSYNYISIYDTVEGVVSDWNPSPNGAVWTSFTKDGMLLLGGEFTEISSVSRPGLALYDFATGVIDPKKNKKIRYYPNPVNDFLTIETDPGEISQIQVVNSRGVVVQRFIRNQDDRSTLLDVSSLPSGLYCFRFLDELNVPVAMEKIVIRQ